MPRGLPRAAGWLGTMAASGAVLAHQLAYFVARPDPHERAEALARAGHGDWSLPLALALGLLVAALATHVRRAALSGASGTPVTAARLAALQVLAFLALEAVERLAAGAEAPTLWGDPAVALGVLAQVLVALAGAQLLRAAGRVAAAWAGRSNRRAARAASESPPAEPLLAPSCEAAVEAGGLRGPPPTPA